MDGTVLSPGVRPRPERWPDIAAGTKRKHTLDWTAVLKNATISSIEWASTPADLTFSGSSVAGAVTTISITPPSDVCEREFFVHAKMTDSNGEIYELNPPIRFKVQPGGDF